MKRLFPSSVIDKTVLYLECTRILVVLLTGLPKFYLDKDGFGRMSEMSRVILEVKKGYPDLKHDEIIDIIKRVLNSDIDELLNDTYVLSTCHS